MAPSIWSLPGGNSNALVKDSDHSFAPCQSFGLSVTRDELLNEVWGFENYPSTRTVENHIATLRAKLENNPAEPRHLLTVPGVGYKLILIHTRLKPWVNKKRKILRKIYYGNKNYSTQQAADCLNCIKCVGVLVCRSNGHLPWVESF